MTDTSTPPAATGSQREALIALMRKHVPHTPYVGEDHSQTWGSAADAILSAGWTRRPSGAAEALIKELQDGICCPRIHGCESKGPTCLIRQAFARHGFIADELALRGDAETDAPAAAEPGDLLEVAVVAQADNRHAIPSTEYALASIGISLKRIADALDSSGTPMGLGDAVVGIALNGINVSNHY